MVLQDGSSLNLSDLEWQTSRFSRAGTFAFSAPVSADAIATTLANFAANLRLSLEVLLTQANVAAAWVRVLVGQADRIRWDPLSQVMMCEGRDLTAVLIGHKVAEGYLNQTSSEIAASLAGECGLTAHVTETQRMVGQYYQIEHRRAPFLTYSGRTTAWDILTELAVIEGFRVYVDKETLVFGPSGTGSGLSDAWSLTGGSWMSASGLGLENIDLEMLPEIDTATEVRVRSWNSRQRTLVDTAPDAAAGRVYDVIRPNMPSDDASRLASSLLQRVTTQAYSIRVGLPGELGFLPGQLVSLTGTQTTWDRVYQIDGVERSISIGGFRQTMTASAFAQGQTDAESS